MFEQNIWIRKYNIWNDLDLRVMKCFKVDHDDFLNLIFHFIKCQHRKLFTLYLILSIIPNVKFILRLNFLDF